MLWALLEDFPYLRHLLSSPLALAFALFQLWMLIDAIRRREWLWLVILLIFPGLGTAFYFFTVYLSGDTATRGFELPGSHSRRRIKELQAQIHHLDKPHHHLALGDIYFQQGKLGPAETHYRAALERDPDDRDARAHLGQCLLRQGRPAEALPLLDLVTREDPRHDYGHSLMALAEAQAALGDAEASLHTWERVLENHSYPRASVQLAELCHARGDFERARALAREVVEADPLAPDFDRRRNRVWVRRARRLLRQTLGSSRGQ